MRISLVCLALLAGCGPNSQVNVTEVESSGSESISAQVWADNWFAFYLEDELIMEDSVSITTERSFNAESFVFNADYPLQLNFIAKDFKENDTGLEYIGARNQQMGDGGFIAQFFNSESGESIAVTNADWKCLVIHEAPSNKQCENEDNPSAGVEPCGFRTMEEPSGWKNRAFDDSSWLNAAEHSASAVDPKDGYDAIDWNSDAKLIWGADLETDNTLLCRATITN